MHIINLSILSADVIMFWQMLLSSRRRYYLCSQMLLCFQNPKRRCYYRRRKRNASTAITAALNTINGQHKLKILKKHYKNANLKAENHQKPAFEHLGKKTGAVADVMIILTSAILPSVSREC